MIAVLDLDVLKHIIIPCLAKVVISLLGYYGVHSLKFLEEFLKGKLSLILVCQSLKFRYVQVALFAVIYISTKVVTQCCPYYLVIHGFPVGINSWFSLGSNSFYVQEFEYHLFLTSKTESFKLNC